MRIPSRKTRAAMEIAADLRAQGATWATIALKVHRHHKVVERWTRYYRDDWLRMMAEAEQRFSQQGGNEGRTKMRTLLHHDNPNVAFRAAKELCHLHLKEKAVEPPANSHPDMSAFYSRLKEMSDDQLQQRIREIEQQDGGGTPPTRTLPHKGKGSRTPLTPTLSRKGGGSRSPPTPALPHKGGGRRWRRSSTFRRKGRGSRTPLTPTLSRKGRGRV